MNIQKTTGNLWIEWLVSYICGICSEITRNMVKTLYSGLHPLVVLWVDTMQ